MGVGNLPHELIPQVVKTQLGSGVVLIDTAHASNNERIIRDAVASFDDSERARERVHTHSRTRGGRASKEIEPLHVVTKVWYTMLGYERTKISVQESLQALTSAGSSRPIYVHMLLHWPRCNEDIPWMNCEEEEKKLPQKVKDAGPPPHLNKGGAFTQSWKALEEIYLEHQKIITESNMINANQSPLIASIGVSNFELRDMKQLMENNPRVPPQIYQGNSWLVFHDPYLMDYLRDHKVFFQAYAVMNGILQRKDESPAAYGLLTEFSHELMTTVSSQNKENKGMVVTEATVLLAYFLHNNIGVIPRAATFLHQQENSPLSLSAVLPHLTSRHIKQLEVAIPALMKGEDPHVQVSFMNGLSSPIQIHWMNPETKEEIPVSNVIHPGSVEVQGSHPGHIFVAYDPERSVRKEFVVDAPYGERQHFMVEL